MKDTAGQSDCYDDENSGIGDSKFPPAKILPCWEFVSDDKESTIKVKFFGRYFCCGGCHRS